MTLIHDDQIKEVWAERFEKTNTALVLRERLIDGEVHLSALYDLAGFDLAPRVAERCKDPVLRLIDEDVSIRQV